MFPICAPDNHPPPRRAVCVLAAGLALATLPAPSMAAALDGPIPGAPPGDRTSPILEETYPFFATWVEIWT